MGGKTLAGRPADNDQRVAVFAVETSLESPPGSSVRDDLMDVPVQRLVAEVERIRLVCVRFEINRPCVAEDGIVAREEREPSRDAAATAEQVYYVDSCVRGVKRLNAILEQTFRKLPAEAIRNPSAGDRSSD
jgi:hypothetical protein